MTPARQAVTRRVASEGCHMKPPSRTLGRHYTPEAIAEFMVDCVLRRIAQDALNQGRDNTPASLRCLDPACGDGVFLEALIRRLSSLGRHCTGSGGQRRAGGTDSPVTVLREQVFAVDIDAEAIAAARGRLQRLLPVSTNGEQIERILLRNVVLGDALTGCDWSQSATPPKDVAAERQMPGRTAVASCKNVPALDWSRAFPEAARQGGFDVILGNPPYLRERDAKPLFDRLAGTELGRRWKQPRMDLWHYFLHRSLDLLRPGGRLAFLVNSYWMHSRSAIRLIERLQAETTLEQLALLGNARIFAGVSGHHMILQLLAGKRDSECTILDLREDPHPARTLRKWTRAGGAGKRDRRAAARPQHELFQNGRLVWEPRPCWARVRTSGRRLGDDFEIRQGMAENPPTLTGRLAQLLPQPLPPGTGVFVLTADELARLKLPPSERDLVRPYYAASEIERYALRGHGKRYVLYLTPQTLPELDAAPHIARHLARFRPIMERRRETQRGYHKWFHLHWPRQEAIFLRPRILCRQMGRRPAFVHVEQPTYVGFSLNVIAERVPEAPDAQVRHESERLPLPTLTAILNSRTADDWFAVHAKRRGVRFDISGTTLREFPLPPFDARRAAQLETLARDAQREREDDRGESTEWRRLDDQIDTLVATWYQS